MSISVSLVLEDETTYDTHLPPWRGTDDVRQAIQVQGGNRWGFTTIQGTAAQLRALADAANAAAGQADAWEAAQPGPDAETGGS